MAENVLYADLNLPEPTRPRILTVPDVQDSSCTYAEVKVKSQETNAAANCKSSGKSCCSRKHAAILVVIILILVLAVYLIITWSFQKPVQKPVQQSSDSVWHSGHSLQAEIVFLFPDGPTAGSQEDSTKTIPAEALGCPTAWKKHGRSCYFFSPETKPKSWEASRAECTAMGSDLVVIDSREELRYLFLQSRYNYYLLGLTRSEEGQKWKWINNVELDPDMFHLNGRYHDYHCTAIGYDQVHTAPCDGSDTTKNMCEKAATIP
ncbi:killer cell lectin-like receptor subfamily B member 1B allele A isoform X1 [Taeniopygia guttata]|uniref:killer cell lectin-like receptor subfamily B member 1B allele A isoform X1 n=1 Tax=Taeniopygia guttata TaxID=59729 RepID=UPI003BB98C12